MLLIFFGLHMRKYTLVAVFMVLMTSLAQFFKSPRREISRISNQ